MRTRLGLLWLFKYYFLLRNCVSFGLLYFLSLLAKNQYTKNESSHKTPDTCIHWISNDIPEDARRHCQHCWIKLSGYKGNKSHLKKTNRKGDWMKKKKQQKTPHKWLCDHNLVELCNHSKVLLSTWWSVLLQRVIRVWCFYSIL